MVRRLLVQLLTSPPYIQVMTQHYKGRLDTIFQDKILPLDTDFCPSYHVRRPVVPDEIVVCSSMTVTTFSHVLSRLYDLKQGINGGPPSSGLNAIENVRTIERCELWQCCQNECCQNEYRPPYLFGTVISSSVKSSMRSSEIS